MSTDDSTFNHNGTICSFADYTLSQSELNSTPLTIHCLSRGESIGLAFATQMGCVSLVAVLIILVMIIYKYQKKAREVGIREVRLFREPIDIYMFNLLISDLIQAVGTVMDIKWVNEGVVKAGDYCTAQGSVQQLGETGVAMTTLAIALHTVITVWWRRTAHWKFLAYSVVGVIWLYLILFVSISRVGERHLDQPTPYWCWIGKEKNFVAYQIMGEYFWFWVTLLMSLFCYIPLFLWARGNIEFDTTSPFRFRWVKLKPGKQRSGSQRQAFIMLAYPLIYSIVILPLSVVRWIEFQTSVKVPSVATFIVIALFGLSGALNVLLLLTTRPEVLLLGSQVDIGRPPSIESTTSIALSTRETEIRYAGNSTSGTTDVEEGKF